MNITDTNIGNKLIQPIRFFRNTYGNFQDKRNYNYYESAKKNVAHQIIKVPTLALIKFQVEFPAYYMTLSELKIYCSDRTTVLYDIKTRLNDQTDASLHQYLNEEGELHTQFIYVPGSGFDVGNPCPEGFGVIRIVATDGTTPITWESDLIELFNFANYYPSGTPGNEADIIDNELGI